MIYFITVNYYSTALISQLINSLPNAKDFQYKLIIINNSPDDQTIEKLTSENILIVDAGCNLGFGSACNLGLKWVYAQDTNALVWIINPDAYFIESNFKLDSFFRVHPEISILGTIICTPSNEIWFAGGRFSKSTGKIFNVDLVTASNADYMECDWVSGCSIIINFRNFTECPLFDPKYFLYYEDFDFCQRYLQKGYKVAITKSFSVIHQPSSITNRHLKTKILHSTYSYLITLEQYTNKLIFSLRLVRLISSIIIFALFKPDIALGKLQAIFIYWRRRSQLNLPRIFD
ncbi:glycosyl transferase [Calothrix sp. NIES-4071]|nr:glycosyl transferase [Calothrix sp. NIES-4071]BAZ64170.1 glycosyl transferase [Calothrix sp. NIES-4105]